MSFNEEISALPNNLFQNHYVLEFVFTAYRVAGENLYCSELIGKRVRLEMFFNRPLRNVAENFFLGDRVSTVKID